MVCPEWGPAATPAAAPSRPAGVGSVEGVRVGNPPLDPCRGAAYLRPTVLQKSRDMAVLSILEAPHPLLKATAAPVEAFDAGLRRLVDDMFDTMYLAPGIGLAAPQVGVLKRVCVADVSDRKKGEEPSRLVLVNPDVVWRSVEAETQEEGCLSLPSQFADVSRPRAVRVRYRDLEGQQRELAADGLLARCLQHEIDHLDGTLFTDRLSTLKRDMIMRKLLKARRARA